MQLQSVLLDFNNVMNYIHYAFQSVLRFLERPIIVIQRLKIKRDYYPLYTDTFKITVKNKQKPTYYYIWLLNMLMFN